MKIQIQNSVNLFGPAAVGAATTYVVTTWSLGAIAALLIGANLSFWAIRLAAKPAGWLVAGILLIFSGFEGLVRARAAAIEAMRWELFRVLSATFVGATLMMIELVALEGFSMTIIPHGVLVVGAMLTGLCAGWYANRPLLAGDI